MGPRSSVLKISMLVHFVFWANGKTLPVSGCFHFLWHYVLHLAKIVYNQHEGSCSL